MNSFKRFINTLPAWAFGLVLLAVTVNTLYFYYRGKVAVDGQSNYNENGKSVISYVTPGGPAEKAGIRPGDILVSVDFVEVHEWSDLYRGDQAGDTAYYQVIRKGELLSLPLVFCTPFSFFPWFHISLYIVLLLLSLASLFLLYKKPNDLSVRIFFIFLQFFFITQNAHYLVLREPIAKAATGIFQLTTCMFGPLLIHFHLLFPKKAKIFTRIKILPLLFYLTGFLLFILYFGGYLKMVEGHFSISAFRFNINRIVLSWLTLTYFLAVGTVIYQYVTIKDTLSRKQLRLVIIGTFFGIFSAVALAFFPAWVDHISAGYPYLINIVQGVGSLMMISFILVAIFHYRIWDIEVIIRKTMLYIGATGIIILCYFLLIFLVNQLTIKETNLTRFLILTSTIIIFLALRDHLQHIIDRVFHRETYDSATVVSVFEEKLAGIYKTEELKIAIAKGLDEIFHFRSFFFGLKTGEQTYEPAYCYGTNPSGFGADFKVSDDFERALKKSKIVLTGELAEPAPFLEELRGELIVPLVKDDQPYGFFICGQKRSEKTYSLQDIRVLTLIGKRIASLFHTASLYQKDIDRQLMLERERARISEDMHDDVGASLTQISILSDLAKSRSGIPEDIARWLEQIHDTSRKVMEEMSQIIWALNPKNDTLEGLIAYLRRFTNEYLEPTQVSCHFDFPDNIPDLALSVEVRRNIYLVVREALHNMVKHASASKVIISVFTNEAGISIVIKDNGIGFDPSLLNSSGNGLINMKKRMNDIDWDFRIISKPEEGTEILLKGDRIPGTTELI